MMKQIPQALYSTDSSDGNLCCHSFCGFQSETSAIEAFIVFPVFLLSCFFLPVMPGKSSLPEYMIFFIFVLSVPFFSSVQFGFLVMGEVMRLYPHEISAFVVMILSCTTI